MPEPTPNPEPNGAPDARGRPYAEDEISLLDILLVVARNKRLIVRTVVVVTVLGVLYALVASEQFTSTAKVIREAETESMRMGGGLAALQGLGINLGGAGSGLSPEAFPEILTSREVRLAVVRDTFTFADEDARMTFVEYTNRPGGWGSTVIDYTVRLPWTLKKALSAPPQRPAGTDADGAPVYPTREEEQAMKAVGSMVSSSINQENGLMTVSVTTGDPQLSADVAQRFLRYLTDRIHTIRTEKARRNLTFIEEEFAAAQEELQAAEEQLAQFADRNQGISSERLRTEQARLERQVRFKADLYSELQAQLTQSQIDLQRSAPVTTIVEAPVPPMQRSAPQRTLIVLLSLILGGFLGLGGAFVKAFFDNTEEDDEEQEKLEEIKTALVPERWRQKV